MAMLETDYLVIGAGASGMAFVDELIGESDADVVMVDRRHHPGGHWNDAYPFVRLHQPSAYYGVNSRALGNDAVDPTGPNAGFYERATAAEICDYYRRVLEERLLPSGQVRFLPMTDYRGEDTGEHHLVARLTGATTTVRVRRKVVDATYIETAVPATHTPAFGIDADVRLVPPNDLIRLPEPGTGYTIIGAGKTAMDTCTWLLDNGVDPDRVRWIKPREAWLLNRAFVQPLTLVPMLIEGVSLQFEAAAQAEDVDDLFRRLEDRGQVIRVDQAVEPTMYRGATVNVAELDRLRQIENVVRQGRVTHLGADRIVFEDGSIANDRGQVHVDCTAEGPRLAPGRTIFEPGRITLQSVRVGLTPFNAALLAFLEATRDDDVEKNRLCPPNPTPTAAIDWLSSTWITHRAQALWSAEPDLVAWLERSRLNVGRGVADHLTDPRMQAAIPRLVQNVEPALAKLEQLLGRTMQPAAV